VSRWRSGKLLCQQPDSGAISFPLPITLGAFEAAVMLAQDVAVSRP